MADFAYTNAAGKLRELFSKLQKIGIPPKASYSWLKSIGYTSSNDRSLLTVLKFIGFADGQGNPTEAWHEYRGKDNEIVMAKQVRQAYQELFQLFPNAHYLSDTDLENFFATKTTAGEKVVSSTVSTFKVLRDFADFDSIVQEEEDVLPEGVLPDEKTGEQIQRQNGITRVPTININVQLTLPENMSAEDYGKFFAAMKKHLFSGK